MSERSWPREDVFEARARLGEGPVWDAEAQRLYWVDIYNQRVHSFDPSARRDELLRLPEIVTCVVPTTSHQLLVALRHELALLEPNTGDLKRILTLEADRPRNRFNDGKVDPHGRFWVGTISPEAPGNGSLYRYDPNGDTRTMQTGVTISNGMGWSPDAGTFYFTDSATKAIYAYDYDDEGGEIANRRVFADLTSGSAFPDGLAVDSDGCVWSAQWDGWCVIRFSPEGRAIQRLPVPVQRPTSCCFGGRDLKTLFITSAAVGLSEREIEKCPLSGDLFWTETEVAGLPGRAWGGGAQ
jgi:sugar lactone lactonase YvrE